MKPANAPAVSLHNVTVAYRQHPALHHISGRFEAGSLTAIIGPNGAGKSTLLKSLLGLVRIDSGHVDISIPRKRVAYLPQQAEIDRGFPISVMDCVLLGYWQRAGLFGGISRAMAEKADAALHAVGLDGFAERSIGSLSAGQFQRVLFARILLQDAELILLDEPFNAVDAKTTEDLLVIVQSWHAQQRTVIAVLHDNEQVRRYFPQAVLLARRLVAWGNTAHVLTDDHLRLAKNMPEAQDPNAPFCHPEPAV
ncbi:metal ABC transporter ATP-binding protein [Glaciimonas sp. PAMC28666]|uniref:metal ABC transporter ATP-binding protein n=1 Tax=Glaciimonas sp. PAMC28666 TaxID=2807626 RepID=UPI00196502FE|nr:ABC transporter ATP-binding protein [Glaciimonas sp. PAMC28666]QRX83535.1 ABC transporter ATP-binding protein [Glaciimonas sp. PAMC28666]